MSVLPFELIHIILSHLPREELHECMKVCRSWYSATSPRFYKELVWRDWRNEELLKLVKKPLIDGKEVGDHALKIEFSAKFHSYVHLQRYEFEAVIDNLSKLKIIYARDTYLNYLHEIPAYKLTQLKEISLESIHGTIDAVNIHYLVNKRLRNQITTLEFSFGDVAINVDREAIMRDLSNYTCLTALFIYNVGRHRVINLEHLITFVLNTCRKLTHFTIRDNQEWTLNETVSITQTNLMSLQLLIPGVDPDHLICIMRCAPNLKELCFRAYGYLYEDLLSMQDVSELLSYLKKLEYVEISTDIELFVPNESTPFFWDFWRNLCGNNYLCDLDVTPEYWECDSYGAKFVKENQHLKATCYIELGIVGDKQWTGRMDFLTFNSISIDNELACFKYGDDDGDGYLDLVRPVLCLLKQQEQACAIYINCGLQEGVVFDSVPVESYRLVEKTRKRLDIGYGNIFGFDELEPEMLNYLSTLYPSTHHLTLRHCITTEKFDEENIYHIDFTQFKRLHQLTCDFDSVFPEQKAVRRLLIQSIGMSGTSKNFYYDKYSLPVSTYLGEQNEIDNPLNIPIVKIHHADSTQLVIKKFTDLCFY